MENRDVCVIDCETTSVSLESTKMPRIIEIGVIKIDKKFNKVRKYQTYINPEEKLNDFVIGYTGINDEVLESAPKFSEVTKELEAFFGGKNCLIASWPLAFELPILQYEYANAKKDFPLDKRGIDIGSMAHYYFIKNGLELRQKERTRDVIFSIDNVARTLDIKIGGTRHSALDDATLEADILIKILKDIKPLQTKKIEELEQHPLMENPSQSHINDETAEVYSTPERTE